MLRLLETFAPVPEEFEFTVNVPPGVANTIVLLVAVMFAEPKCSVLPDNHKSLQRYAVEPKSYVTLALGIRLPLTLPPVNGAVATPAVKYLISIASVVNGTSAKVI